MVFFIPRRAVDTRHSPLFFMCINTGGKMLYCMQSRECGGYRLRSCSGSSAHTHTGIQVCNIMQFSYSYIYCTENLIYLFPEMKLRGLVPNSHIHVYVNICSQDRSAYLAAAKQANRSWEYINCSQIHKCGNWEIEKYNLYWILTGPSFAVQNFVH